MSAVWAVCVCVCVCVCGCGHDSCLLQEKSFSIAPQFSFHAHPQRKSLRPKRLEVDLED